MEIVKYNRWQHRVRDASTSSFTDLLNLQMYSGAVLIIPLCMLEGADIEKMRNVQIGYAGMSIHFPDADLDFAVEGLCNGLYGTKKWMERLEADGVLGEIPEPRSIENE